jgi:hypothetical protein
VVSMTWVNRRVIVAALAVLTVIAVPVPALAGAKLTCPISSVSLSESSGGSVTDAAGQRLGHSLAFGLRAQVDSGTATVAFRGVTYELSAGSRFFTMCYTPSNLTRGLIPMVALASGRDGTSRVSVSAAADAPGEAGALADRLAGIGRAGARWSLTVIGPPSARYSVSATEAVSAGGPVQAVVPRTDDGHLRHALLYEVRNGHFVFVSSGQHVVTGRGSRLAGGDVSRRVAAPGAASASAAAASTITGTIVAVHQGDFILRTAGSAGGRLNAMISYATRLEAKNYPYVFGGGHVVVGSASEVHGKTGFDCSGVVAAVLAAGGLWPKRASVPGDAGVIQQLAARKLIASGAASGPYQVALFDDPGRDIVMKIGGRLYSTGNGSRGGGGWFDGGTVTIPGVYKQYHVLPSALGERSSDSDALTFSFGPGASQRTIATEVTVGATVQVSYAEADSSTIRAESITSVGGTPLRGASAGGPLGAS